MELIDAEFYTGLRFSSSRNLCFLLFIISKQIQLCNENSSETACGLRKWREKRRENTNVLLVMHQSPYNYLKNKSQSVYSADVIF